MSRRVKDGGGKEEGGGDAHLNTSLILPKEGAALFLQIITLRLPLSLLISSPSSSY